jgi:hypothetical protein
MAHCSRKVALWRGIILQQLLLHPRRSMLLKALFTAAIWLLKVEGEMAPSPLKLVGRGV